MPWKIILTHINTTEATSFDITQVKVLRSGAEKLAMPLSSFFPEDCETAKLKPLDEKNGKDLS